MRTYPIALAVLSLLVGCGGASTLVRTERRPISLADVTPPRAGGEPDPEVAITGLMGGIDPHSVERAMRPRLDALAACVEDRRADGLPLGGRVRLDLRIAIDGSVRWVVPRESTIGDRDAERCILDVAAATRFRPPSGGEAEASWTFDLDGGALETAEHVAWEARRVRSAVARGRSRIERTCGESEGLRVTAWVGPRGRVLRAGASAPDVARGEAIDCVLDAIRGWRMPDPRGRIARVTFEIR